MNTVSRCLLSVFACLMATSAPAQAMPVVELAAGMYRIEAEAAVTEPDRERGLMFRKAMPEHHGMLFAFPVADQHCMWMRNTLLPLSVAFLDGQGRIINIEDMQPQTTDNHCAAKPARYALEMNLGWFARRNWTAGRKISGLEKIPFAQ